MVQRVPERPAGGQFDSSLLSVLQQFGYAINHLLDRFEAPLPLAIFEAADLPDAADWEGAIVYVSDGSSGQKFRGSDGTNWVNLG